MTTTTPDTTVQPLGRHIASYRQSALWNGVYLSPEQTANSNEDAPHPLVCSQSCRVEEHAAKLGYYDLHICTHTRWHFYINDTHRYHMSTHTCQHIFTLRNSYYNVVSAHHFLCFLFAFEVTIFQSLLDHNRWRKQISNDWWPW